MRQNGGGRSPSRVQTRSENRTFLRPFERSSESVASRSECQCLESQACCLGLLWRGRLNNAARVGDRHLILRVCVFVWPQLERGFFCHVDPDPVNHRTEHCKFHPKLGHCPFRDLQYHAAFFERCQRQMGTTGAAAAVDKPARLRRFFPCSNKNFPNRLSVAALSLPHSLSLSLSLSFSLLLNCSLKFFGASDKNNDSAPDRVFPAVIAVRVFTAALLSAVT